MVERARLTQGCTLTANGSLVQGDGCRQSIGTQLYLMRTLLTTHIEYFLLWDIENSLESKRTLSDTRLTTEQGDTSLHHTTTEHTIQLRIVHINARLIMRRDVTKFRRSRRTIGTHAAKHGSGTTMSHRHTRIASRLRARISSDTNLLESIPLSTARTLAYPFRRLLPTIAANVCYLIFCHTAKVRQKIEVKKRKGAESTFFTQELRNIKKHFGI